MERARLIEDYINYIGESECPLFFHRWAFTTAVGAFLGRRVHINFLDTHIHPNTYVLFLGEAGSRKSTAITTASKLLHLAGYTNFASAKTSKERFLLDMSGMDEEDNEFVDYNDLPDSEMFIAADEGLDFFGQGQIEFLSTLGQMWDYDLPVPFESKIKNGKSACIHNPTVSILSGFTPTNFSLSFPPEILGQGFFSRLLVISARESGRKIAFPKKKDQSIKAKIIETLIKIRASLVGEYELTQEAKDYLEQVYLKWTPLSDARFVNYSSRRFTHLLKLCLINAVIYQKTEIDLEVAKYSNTLLTHAEKFMPSALGEFGKAKNADVTHKVMQLLDSAYAPISTREIYKAVAQDVESISAVSQILTNLLSADKVQSMGQGKWLPKKEVREDKDAMTKFIDLDYLTEEERSMPL